MVPLAAGQCPTLPANLGEVLVAFAADARLFRGLDDAFCRAYVRLLGRQWQAVANSQVGIELRRLGLDV